MRIMPITNNRQNQPNFGLKLEFTESAKQAVSCLENCNFGESLEAVASKIKGIKLDGRPVKAIVDHRSDRTGEWTIIKAELDLFSPREASLEGHGIVEYRLGDPERQKKAEIHPAIETFLEHLNKAVERLGKVLKLNEATGKIND